MKRKLPAVIAVTLIMGSMFLLLWGISQPKKLVDTDSLKIVALARYIRVYDCLGSREYIFSRKIVRRSEAPREAQTAIQTPTIRIDTIKGGGLLVESSGIVYRITPKRGRCY